VIELIKEVKQLINSNDNNTISKEELSLNSVGRRYLNYQSKIIVGIYSFLQEHEDKQIEDLFSNAVDLFNALGSWIFGEASPKIVYPELQLFLRKANTANNENFSDFLEYINWMGNSLFKMLEENELIEDHYYESFTLKQSNDVTTGLMFMWRLGWLSEKIKEIANKDDVPILLQIQNAQANLFDSFGNWIYHQEETNNITRSLKQLEKLIGEKSNSIYDELVEETRKTSINVAKFLQKL
jgi:hypothetical protein